MLVKVVLKVGRVEYKYINPRGGYVVYLVTSEQMQLFDKYTIEHIGIPGIVLMDHAGWAVARIVLRQHPERVVVLCGKGNNGADGWICARWLHHAGVSQVQVISTVSPQQLTGDAWTASQSALAMGVPFTVWTDDMELPTADVYVDAILGTGSTRPISASLGRLVERVNASSAWTIAVDVPTGVNASTGEIEHLAIRAKETVTFNWEKLGLAVSPGCEWAGTVHVEEIGICMPPSVDTHRLAEWITPQRFRQLWADRKHNSHKGSFGRIGVVVGQMQGASLLAAAGAARVGVGLVILAVHKALQMSVPWDYVLRDLDAEQLYEHLADCHAIVYGPGLGQFGTIANAVKTPPFWDQYQGLGVIDADGLRAIGEAGGLQQTGPRFVLTPHPKECARLLGWSTERVLASRLAAGCALAEKTGSIVLLKGYHTLIVHPDGRIRVNSTGDASLSVGGTGDVLAGMVGGLMAQGLEPFDAAALAAWLHGKAGELAGQALTKVSVMASDVVEFISRAIHLYFDMITQEF